MAIETSDKILIIGAGLGGLTLAQILWANKVPFELFERDSTTSSRKQGWAVALVECLPALEELLPSEITKDLYKNSVNSHTGDHDEIGFVDALTGEKFGAVGGVPHGQPGFMLRVGRESFRTFLWKSENLPVSSGKNFTHYVEDEEGVTAYFEDGATARGGMLIGADGCHSHVRRKLFEASNPTLSRYVSIFGEVSLPQDLYEPIRKLGKAAFLAGAPGVRQQMGVLAMEKHDPKAHFFWALMLLRDKPEELTDWVHGASNDEIYDFAIESTKNLHPTLKDPIRFGGPEGIARRESRMMDFVPPETVPKGHVTVLGDAAHAMLPFRGAGANTALLDACDLGRLLIKSSQEGQHPTAVLQAYHEVMIPRGQKNVLSSRAAGNVDDDIAATWARMFQKRQQQ